MSLLRFDEDLSKAQRTRIKRVSDLARGEISDISFNYHHDSVAEPIVIHMIAHDSQSYPKNPGFIIYSEYDNTDNDFTRCLDSVCEKQPWSNIEGAVRVMAAALTSAITSTTDRREKRVSGSLKDSDDSSDHAVHPTLAAMRTSLQKAQSFGITVGIFARRRSEFPPVISLSVPATCLGVTAAILEAWGIRETDNLVLLLRVDGPYPPFAQILNEQAILQVRFGKCLGEKPSTVSVTEAYRDARIPFEDGDLTTTIDGNIQYPFELIHMSSPLDRLLSSDGFLRILAAATRFKVAWPNAQRLVTQLELRSGGVSVQIDQAESDAEALKLLADPIPWQSLMGPVAQDITLDTSEAFNLPLVAIQFALHRLANCTRYCMVCNSCLEEGLSALKPYVCPKSSCLSQYFSLFSYLSLGLGPSIEHEIINAPYVVDMLICFLYSALSDGTGRELPYGLDIDVADIDIDDEPSEGSYATAFADMQLMRLRCLDYSRIKRLPFRIGDRVLIVHREAAESTALGSSDWIIKSWCRLIEPVEGDWILERHRYSESLSDTFHSPNSPISRLSREPVPGSNWRHVLLFGYWQKIDDLKSKQRSSALLDILDWIPSVLDMRKFLMAHPRRLLGSWNLIQQSDVSLLNWIVASNRSLIVQDDVVRARVPQGMAPDTISSNKQSLEPEAISAPESISDNGQSSKLETSPEPRQIWHKIGHGDPGMLGWMQFRFLQGSPEREQKFEQKVGELMKTTQTPTIFAWHGSNLKNWHSIIRTGLDFPAVGNGRVARNGVYFSNSMNITNLSYCDRRVALNEKSNVLGHWPNSELQINSAIALCELINCPSKFVRRKPYVVDQLDWIQCRYLLVAANPSADAIGFPFYEPQTSETPEYVAQDPSYPIFGFSGPVEIPVTAIPFSRRALQPTARTQSPTTTTNVPSTENVSSTGNAPESKNTAPLIRKYDIDDVELFLGAGAGMAGSPWLGGHGYLGNEDDKAH